MFTFDIGASDLLRKYIDFLDDDVDANHHHNYSNDDDDDDDDGDDDDDSSIVCTHSLSDAASWGEKTHTLCIYWQTLASPSSSSFYYTHG